MTVKGRCHHGNVVAFAVQAPFKRVLRPQPTYPSFPLQNLPNRPSLTLWQVSSVWGQTAPRVASFLASAKYGASTNLVLLHC